MKIDVFKKTVAAFGAALLIGTAALPTVSAEERNVLDESIYDTLVDRFFNGTTENDQGADPTDNYDFNGGDFAGLQEKLEYIQDMGFTAVSIGPIFETATYDGRAVLTYGAIEDRFGTDKELKDMISAYHDADMEVYADFPLGGVSQDHEWASGREGWAVPAEDGESVDWDLENEEVQDALIDAAVTFAEETGIDGVRLTRFGDADTAFLDRMIAALKETSPSLVVFSDAPSEAEFDLDYDPAVMEILRSAFVEMDPDSSGMDELGLTDPPTMMFFDDLNTTRFTTEMVDRKMFPPTRWNVAATALFTLPGVPVMTYGSEIAVAGKEAPGTHPLHNFKTDEELKDHIADVNGIRNQSETLRTGDFELLHNDNGLIVYERSSDEETWVIVLNNTSETQRVDLTAEQLGEGKRLRALIDNNLVSQADSGEYRIVLDREAADLFIVEEDTGLNIPYIIAAILVYATFIGFIYMVWRKGKQRAKDGKAGKSKA
ncbi:Beta/alpha-amylase precursor [Bhargavaea cecembensis DSE10]|uniref:Beta/alpha-amylase n=1 Tax=Bhargavaea cecembensis DSE10 TaxID=1235279 RepID=M7PBY6_9BACL|nr:Beta/alpha-amylase precursor [Bhargavaea cecembensis DSE10]